MRTSTVWRVFGIKRNDWNSSSYIFESMKSKILRMFFTVPFTKKKLTVFKPCMYYIHPHAHISIGKYLHFNRSWDDDRMVINKQAGSLYVAEGASLEVGSFDAYAGCRINVNPGASLYLGSGYMNHDCVIDCFDSITVGQNVVISERVVMRDSDNHTVCTLGEQEKASEEHVITAPIVVKDHVWIGMNVTILKGVTIGEGSIVAAGSVVTRSIPPHCLAAGVPAKVIKTGVAWC